MDGQVNLDAGLALPLRRRIRQQRIRSLAHWNDTRLIATCGDAVELDPILNSQPELMALAGPARTLTTAPCHTG